MLDKYRLFLILSGTMAVVVVGVLVKSLFSRIVAVQSPLLVGADVRQASVSKDKIGVFGLPDDSVATDLGVGWSRLPLLWKDYENNLSKIDSQQEKLKTTKTLYTIRAINSQKTNCYNLADLIAKYGSDLPAEVKNNPNDYASCVPKDMGVYRQFISDLATKYKGSVQAWQIENEVYGFQPQYWAGDQTFGEIDNYLILLRTAYQEIKLVDSNVPVLAAGIALHNKADFDQFGNLKPVSGPLVSQAINKNEANVVKLLTSGCRYFDVIDLHLYHTLDSIPNRVAWLKRLMRENNCVKPIWTTETSGPNPVDPANDLTITDSNLPNINAQDLPTRLSAMLVAGEEKVFYYPYQDNPATPVAKVFGLVNQNGDKKPAYFALQRFTGSGGLSGATSPNNNTTPRPTPGQPGNSLNGSSGPTRPTSPTPNYSGSALFKFINLKANPMPRFPTTPAGILILLVRLIIMLSATIFLIMLLIGGISYLTSSGNEEGTAKAKKTMLNAIIGLLITLSAYGIGLTILKLIGFRV